MKYRESICCIIWKIVFLVFSLSLIVQSRQPSLICYRSSLNDSQEFDLENFTPFLSTKYYNASGDICYFYVSGYGQRSYGAPVLSIMEVFIKYRSKTSACICQLQYDDQANTYLNYVLDPLNVTTILINYPIAVEVSKSVGKSFGQAICDASNAGLSLAKVHVYGHSLGGQVAGFAGRAVIECTGGQAVARIIGLDAAGPGFQLPLKLAESIGPDCANFVAILHTDPLRFGITANVGHCDIRVNPEYYAKNKEQPECVNATELFCSHQLSPILLKESIMDPYIVVAIGDQNQKIYFGDYIDTSSRGVYNVCTNAAPPYAKGDPGTDMSQCIV